MAQGIRVGKGVDKEDSKSKVNKKNIDEISMCNCQLFKQPIRISSLTKQINTPFNDT